MRASTRLTLGSIRQLLRDPGISTDSGSSPGTPSDDHAGGIALACTEVLPDRVVHRSGADAAQESPDRRTGRTVGG